MIFYMPFRIVIYAHKFFIAKSPKTYIIYRALERRLMVGQEILVLFIMVRIRALQPKLTKCPSGHFLFETQGFGEFESQIQKNYVLSYTFELLKITVYFYRNLWYNVPIRENVVYFLLMVSTTCIFGCFCAFVIVTNLPVIALRATLKVTILDSFCIRVNSSPPYAR